MKNNKSKTGNEDQSTDNFDNNLIIADMNITTNLCEWVIFLNSNIITDIDLLEINKFFNK